ncbi:hypothetical protein Taro_040231, partial [Colocasia esculenta]|nr:hypothetical protein [Colocasia esculenta]
MLGRLASKSARTSQHTCWPPRTGPLPLHRTSQRSSSHRPPQQPLHICTNPSGHQPWSLHNHTPSLTAQHRALDTITGLMLHTSQPYIPSPSRHSWRSGRTHLLWAAQQIRLHLQPVHSRFPAPPDLPSTTAPCPNLPSAANPPRLHMAQAIDPAQLQIRFTAPCTGTLSTPGLVASLHKPICHIRASIASTAPELHQTAMASFTPSAAVRQHPSLQHTSAELHLLRQHQMPSPPCAIASLLSCSSTPRTSRPSTIAAVLSPKSASRGFQELPGVDPMVLNGSTLHSCVLVLGNGVELMFQLRSTSKENMMFKRFNKTHRSAQQTTLGESSHAQELASHSHVPTSQEGGLQTQAGALALQSTN